VQAMLRRAMSPATRWRSNTTLLAWVSISSTAEADDNVPVGQARQMREQLAGFHHDFDYHEQAGAGHWWDVSPEPGADCVDWPPLFDFFAVTCGRTTNRCGRWSFATASPGVFRVLHWAGILAQIHPLQISSVRLRRDPGLRRFAGTTENVARLALALDTSLQARR